VILNVYTEEEERAGGVISQSDPCSACMDDVRPSAMDCPSIGDVLSLILAANELGTRHFQAHSYYSVMLER